MNVFKWFYPVLLMSIISIAQAGPANDYEKSLLDEAAETSMKGEKLQATEIEPPVAPAGEADVQALAESITRSLEEALADKHDVAAIKQQMGSVVAGALGQGMNLDEIRDVVQSAMSNMQTEGNTQGKQALESANQALDEVIEANRKLIEGSGGDEDSAALNNEIRDAVAASTAETAGKTPAFSGVDGAGKAVGEQRHTVKKDETLSLIARQYYKDGLKYWKIYQANQELLSNPDIILVGQELKIPE